MEHRLDKAYPKHQTGRFKNVKNLTSVVLQIVLFVTPWVNWQGRPVLMLDLPGRKLHLFAWTFWPQETHFIFLLLVTAGVTLFLVTSLLGRIWCGYACPQTLLSHSFILIERLIEGDRARRIRLEKGPWKPEKFAKLFLKWSLWLAMSVFLGITFSGYYTPIRPLVADFLSGRASQGTLLIIGFFTGVSVLFFGFLRGRFCSTMCPYARFQGAMFDRDTVMVNYDPERGEPRGHAGQEGAGDCVDCKLCVQVCPQNIDIRQGVQFECINCAACVDACDSIMHKLHRPSGLVRYASENEIEGTRTRWLRPRPVAYALALLAILSTFAGLLWTRAPLDMDVLRGSSDSVFSRTTDGRVSNVYDVQLINKQGAEKKVRLSLEGLEGAELVTPVNPVTLPSEELRSLKVFVVANPELVKSPVSHFRIVAADVDSPTARHEVETTFLRGGL